MALYDPTSRAHTESSDIALSEQIPLPPIGTLPPQVLVRDAAEGRRGAAWRLFHKVIENDPQALEAVSSSRDPRLAQNLLEFIALGTWAGKPFDVPISLRSPYARTRLRTLFAPPSGIDQAVSEGVLLPVLRDRRLAVRETAMNLLGIMGSNAAVPDLIAALRDPAPSTRQQAIKALGRTGSLEAVSALLNALHGADEQEGNQIFLALVNLGHVAVPALLEASETPSAWMRWHCLRALGEIHDGRAIPRLVHALTDIDHGVAWVAAKGLAPFGRECLTRVLSLLTSAEMTSWLRETASYVLSKQCSSHAELKPYLDPVIRQMHQSSFREGTGYTALQALTQLERSGVLARH